MSNILTIATAGLVPGQLEDTDHREYGRIDYLALRQRIGTDVLNYNVYKQNWLGGFLRSLEVQLRSDLYLAMLGASKKRIDLTFAMSERVGIPLAAFRKLNHAAGKFVTMFQSWSWRQQLAIERLDLLPQMDGIFVHCHSMKAHLVAMGAAAEHVHVLPYSVDQKFFCPQTAIVQQPNLVFSIGESRSRNYAMLSRAVEGLPIDLHLAAGGSWYAREKKRRIPSLPANIQLTPHLSPRQLRDLYARAQFVILPVYDLVYSAGSTGAMEAASMARAVIATRSRGITDYIIDGETGILVRPDDAGEMRAAIEHLYANPGEAARLGNNARQWVEEKHNFETYVNHMADLLLRYIGPLE